MAKEKKQSPTFKPISVKVGNNLFIRLTNHINELSVLNRTQISKHQWYEEAIREKLQQEDSDSLDEEKLKQKYVFAKISEDLEKQVDLQIDKFKSSRISYSKKQWLVDALYEKLDRDERKVKEMLQNKITRLLENGS